MQIAGDVRMPLTRLFGISANGFNSGEDDIENYNSMIESEIRGKVKTGLLKVLKLCCQNQFGFIPDDLKIEFKPLRILSAQQQEEVKNQQFQRVSGAVQAGLITPLEAKQAINKENLLPIEVRETDELANIPEESKKALSKAAPGITMSTPRANSKSWWKRIFTNVIDRNGDKHGDDGKYARQDGGKAQKPSTKSVAKEDIDRMKRRAELEKNAFEEAKQVLKSQPERIKEVAAEYKLTKNDFLELAKTNKYLDMEIYRNFPKDRNWKDAGIALRKEIAKEDIPAYTAYKEQEFKDKSYERLKGISPAAEIRGDEFQGGSIEEKRENAKDYVTDNFSDKTFENKSLGKQIKVLSPEETISKSANIDKVNSFKYLDKILNSGIHIMSDVDLKGRSNVKAWHYMASKITVQENKKPVEKIVRFSVREDNNGNIYYNHIIDEA